MEYMVKQTQVSLYFAIRWSKSGNPCSFSL